MNNKVIVDANVPAKASTPPNLCVSDELIVQRKCIEYIERLINGNDELVLDLDYEIVNEYRNNVDASSNIGRLFFRWLYQYIGKMDLSNNLKLEKNEEGEYMGFPLDEDTKGFDPNDRKYIALANLHPQKPPIVEGTDGKWFGYVSAFRKYGIKIVFLDEEYVQKMYKKKILDRKGIQKKD